MCEALEEMMSEFEEDAVWVQLEIRAFGMR